MLYFRVVFSPTLQNVDKNFVVNHGDRSANAYQFQREEGGGGLLTKQLKQERLFHLTLNVATLFRIDKNRNASSSGPIFSQTNCS